MAAIYLIMGFVPNSCQLHGKLMEKDPASDLLGAILVSLRPSCWQPDVVSFGNLHADQGIDMAILCVEPEDG